MSISDWRPHCVLKVIAQLQENYALTDEADLKDYLGVRIERLSDGLLSLRQTRIIQRCLEFVKMLPKDEDYKVKTHDTPPLPYDTLDQVSSFLPQYHPKLPCVPPYHRLRYRLLGDGFLVQVAQLFADKPSSTTRPVHFHQPSCHEGTSG